MSTLKTIILTGIICIQSIALANEIQIEPASNKENIGFGKIMWTNHNFNQAIYGFDRRPVDLFKQDMFYYKFNLKLENYIWVGSKACKIQNLKSPQWIRDIKSSMERK